MALVGVLTSSGGCNYLCVKKDYSFINEDRETATSDLRVWTINVYLVSRHK